ncbi:MAG: thioredoxin-disulfide reductase [bacterium]|nr:thioredoxin-disulfide reductase [bacterium]
MEVNEKDVYDIIVVGSGPAGLTAAIYAARANLSVFVIAGVEAGGQLIWTTDVEDFPGFPEAVQGPELVERMRKQAERLGARFINEDVAGIETDNQPFKLKTSQEEFSARAVILATGASAKWLGLESEQRLRAKGVSACAVCDAPFFRGKEVAVVGGGDAALREAVYLTKFCPKVIIIHRSEKLRAFQALQEKVRENPKIEIIFNTQVTEVLGENTITGVRTKNTAGEEKEISLGGLFIAIGHKPNTDFLKGKVELDEKGYIAIKDKSKTSVPGIFAAGDVHDWRYQQAVTAAGAGCMAALDAEEFLGERKPKG